MSAGIVMAVVEEYDEDEDRLVMVAPGADPLVLSIADDFEVYPPIVRGDAMVGSQAAVMVTQHEKPRRGYLDGKPVAVHFEALHAMVVVGG